MMAASPAAQAASEEERLRQFEAAEAKRRAEYDAAEARRQADWAAGEADRLRALAEWEAAMAEWQREEDARVAAAAVASRAAHDAMEQRMRAVEERRESAERAAAERGAGAENPPFTVWVRMMAGRNIEFSGIHADDLVDKILLGIYDRENIPVDQLRLVCPLSHYELEPGSELFVYGITGDWTLHMVRMLRGDGPERRSRPIMPQTELEPAEPFVPATFSPAP